LPKELREDLLSHFLNPDIKKSEIKETKEVKSDTDMNQEIREVSSNNIDSKIITFQHAELISKMDG